MSVDDKTNLQTLILMHTIRAIIYSINLQQHAGEIWIREFEMSFVIEFEKCRAVRVIVLQVQVMHFWFGGGMTTVFAYIHLKVVNFKWMSCNCNEAQ